MRAVLFGLHAFKLVKSPFDKLSNANREGWVRV